MKFITSTELNFEWKYIGFPKPNQTNPPPQPPKKAKESRLVGNNAKILVPVIKRYLV